MPFQTSFHTTFQRAFHRGGRARHSSIFKAPRAARCDGIAKVHPIRDDYIPDPSGRPTRPPKPAHGHWRCEVPRITTSPATTFCKRYRRINPSTNRHGPKTSQHRRNQVNIRFRGTLRIESQRNMAIQLLWRRVRIECRPNQVNIRIRRSVRTESCQLCKGDF